MAKPQWISASDPYFAQFTRPGEFGEENPYSSTIAGLQTPELWKSVARSLGYSGPFETQVISSETSEGGGGYVNVPAPEFYQFIAQKKAEGYDFVTKADQINKDNQTIGLRTPTGEVINQTPVKVSGFGDFFKEFVLPAAGIAFGMGGLNSLMGGGAAAAPANALTGIEALAGVPADPSFAAGMGVDAGMAALTPEVLANISAGVGGASMASAPIFDLGGNVINPVTSEILSPASTTPGTLPPLTPLTPGAGAKPGLTGIPALDKAIDLVTSPAGQAVVDAVGSVASGAMQANAAEAAADQQAEAARNALALQREMFEYQKGLLEPYRTAGTAALERLEGALGLGGAAQPQQMLEMDPGYGFRLGEGMKALERMQAARGNMLSGGAMKAGQRYAQDYASNEYDRAFGRLADIAGIGRSTAAQQGTAAQQFGTSAGNVMGQEANALAAGRIGRGSAYSGAIQGGLNAFQNYFNRQQEEQLFRDIFGRTAIGG